MIDDFKYGCFYVSGREFLGDLMMIQDNPHYWQSREGRKVSMNDLKDVLAHKPEIIIVGTGAGGLLNVPEEIVKTLYERGIRVITEKNTVAIEKYNKLLESDKLIAGLFPGSC